MNIDRSGQIGRKGRPMLELLLFDLIALVALLASIGPPHVARAHSTGEPIRDMNGRTLRISLPASRAITLAPVLSAYATIDGGASHLVASADAAKEEQVDEPLAKIYPALAQLPGVGPITLQDPERVLIFHPDVVFAWSNSRPLREIGFPGLFEIEVPGSTVGASIDDRLALWRMIGKITDRPQRTETLLKGYLEKLDTLKRELPPTNGHKPRVLVVRLAGDVWILVGAGSDFYLDYAIAYVGAENAVPSGQLFSSGTIDTERILRLQPDFILLDAIPQDQFPDTLYRQPRLSIIRAVAEHKVYAIPHFVASLDPVEDPLLLRWLAEVFYPTQMPCGLREDVHDAYFSGYDYKISDDEIDRLVMLEPNGASSGYQRFARTCAGGKSGRNGS